MRTLRRTAIVFFICQLLLHVPLSFAQTGTLVLSDIKNALAREEYRVLKPAGATAIEPRLTIYQAGDVDMRRRVANALYYLSIKSTRAREMLMKDVHTQHHSGYVR